MLKNWKSMIIVNCALWFVVGWSIIAVEMVMLNNVVWSLVGGVSALLLILLNGYFIYCYNKNKLKIKDLKNQYIETLKPDKPLRFCPSDEELVKMHNSKEHTEIQSNTTAEKTTIVEENTQEEEIELENL